MTYAWPPFPRPVGPLQAVCPRTGRIARPGDRVRHCVVGPGTVEDTTWDCLAGMAIPIVRLDGADHAYPYGWGTILLTSHDTHDS